MGLPVKYLHPEHGLCLTLHAALAQLRAAKVPHRAERDAIYVQQPDGSERCVSPLMLPFGKMYALRALGIIKEASDVGE
jgi:hypothetical protein